MNIPKPAIIVGLVALIGVYVASQRADEAAQPPAASHTHADGTTHEGATHGGEEAALADTSQSTPPNVKPNGRLQIEDVRKGTGAVAVDGKTLSMHYRGTLLTGKQFDASYDRGTPFEFVLGGGQVIKGWDQGIKNMKVGGKRRLVIPPDLGYGDRGAGNDIPPGATLVFEVELLDVK